MAPMPINTSKEAKTTTQRVNELRTRRAADGITEVRGLFIETTLHDEFKRRAPGRAKRLKAKLKSEG